MIHWNVDPEIFNIAGFGPRYYGLAFVLGFIIAERYIGKFLLRDGYTAQDVSKLFTFSLFGTIIGARLGHCLFYEPGYYLSNPILILKVWEGGLASHGGFLGVMISIWLFNRKVKRISYLYLLDLAAAPALLTGSFIRIGNLMNSEILGHPSNVSWAFIFERVDNIPRHPAQIYESFGYFCVSMLVFYLYSKYEKVWPHGRFVGITLVLGMSWRFFTEFFKDNQVAFEQGMTLNMGQLLSIPMILIGLALIYQKQFLGKKN